MNKKWECEGLRKGERGMKVKRERETGITFIEYKEGANYNVEYQGMRMWKTNRKRKRNVGRKQKKNAKEKYKKNERKRYIHHFY